MKTEVKDSDIDIYFQDHWKYNIKWTKKKKNWDIKFRMMGGIKNGQRKKKDGINWAEINLKKNRHNQMSN